MSGPKHYFLNMELLQYWGGLELCLPVFPECWD